MGVSMKAGLGGGPHRVIRFDREYLCTGVQEKGREDARPRAHIRDSARTRQPRAGLQECDDTGRITWAVPHIIVDSVGEASVGIEIGPLGHAADSQSSEAGPECGNPRMAGTCPFATRPS